MSCSSRRPPSSPAPTTIWDHPSKDTSVTPNVHGRMENFSTHQGWPQSVLESLTMVRMIRFVCMDVYCGLLFSFLSPPVFLPSFHIYLLQTSVDWSLGNSSPGDKQLSSGRCNTELKPVNHVFREVPIPLGIKSMFFNQSQQVPPDWRFLSLPVHSLPCFPLLTLLSGRFPLRGFTFTVPS